jgi:hypothetical protein
MVFGDLSLLQQILIGLTVPPILTVICWFGGRRLARGQRQSAATQNRAGFWAMLIAAYLLFALALVSSRFFAGSDSADPSTQMVQ